MNLNEIIIELLRIRTAHQRKAIECAALAQTTELAQEVAAAERITAAIIILDRNLNPQ